MPFRLPASTRTLFSLGPMTALVLALLSTLPAAPAHATVYRCPQPGGGVAFQGQPCTGATVAQHQYTVTDRRPTPSTAPHPPRTSSLDGGTRAPTGPAEAGASTETHARYAASVAERASRQVRLDELNGRLAGLERENRNLATAMARRAAEYRAQHGYDNDHLSSAGWERVVTRETNALNCDDATRFRRNQDEMRGLQDDVARLAAEAEAESADAPPAP